MGYQDRVVELFYPNKKNLQEPQVIVQHEVSLLPCTVHLHVHNNTIKGYFAEAEGLSLHLEAHTG